MKDYISEILYILKDAKIKKASDLNSYGEIISGTKYIPSFTGQTVETDMWVKSIYQLAEELLQEQRLYLSHQKKYIVSENDTEEYLKYMCYFPSTSVVTSKSFVDGNTPSEHEFYWNIPKEFLIKVLTHKELLQHNVFTLIPETIEHKMDGEPGYEIEAISGTYSECSPPPNILGNNGIFLSENKIEKLYTTFSWLYGASIEDYQELISKNKLLFDQYRHTLISFMDHIYEDDFQDFKYQLEEADISIRREMEKAKAELLKKGKKAVVSIGLTCIPLLPGIAPELREKLITVFGVTSINQIYSTIEGATKLIKDAGKDNPFWLAWQWEKLSKK